MVYILEDYSLFSMYARRLSRWIKKNKKELQRAAMVLFGIWTAIGTYVGSVTPAAAADLNYSVNWTALGDMIGGVGDLMPSVGNLVIAVVPIILLLIVVGFVVGLFDSIIGAIRDAFRMFGR